MSNAIYSNARAKAKEKQLLSKEALIRISEMDLDDAVKAVVDSGFGGGVSIKNPIEFEKLIREEYSELFSFLKETSPVTELADFFMLKNDYHNALALIRSKYLKTEAEQIKTADGKYSFNYLKERIMADDYSAFTVNMANALSKIDLMFVEKRANGENTDTLMKQALYKDLKNLSEKIPAVKEIFSFTADVVNIGISLRFKDYVQAKTRYVVGGTFKEQDLAFICKESGEAVIQKYSFNKLSGVIKSAIESFNRSLPLTDAEKLSDDYALTYLYKNRYNVNGIYPYLLYIYYKLAEIKNIRIILVGKINGISESQIKSMLRFCYE